jgi:hypothetical protein
MSENTQSYPALFLGRRFISGNFSEEKLKKLVSEISCEYAKPSTRHQGAEFVRNSSLQTGKHTQDESRCNLEVADRHLHVTYIRKDEGFESDGESTKSSSNSMESANNATEKSQIHSEISNLKVDNFINQQVVTNTAGCEVKIVKDHVFRHPNDSKRNAHPQNTPKSQASPSTSLELETSSAASSGSEYDENMAFKSSGPHSIIIKDKSKTVTPTIILKNNSEKATIHTIDPNSSSEATSSSTTSKSNSPTADLQRYKFDHKETYSMKDVVNCHTDKAFGASSQVVWVIRSNRRNILVLVFECVGGENDVNQLCKQFNEMKKKSKFEFARRRKTIEPIFNPNNNYRTRNPVSKSVEVLLGRSKKTIPDPLMLSNNEMMKTKKLFNSSIYSSHSNNANYNNKTLSEKQSRGGDIELMNGHEHHPSLMTLTHDNVGLRHYSHQQSHQRAFEGDVKIRPEGHKMWNLVQHTDSNGITHIEIESKSLPSGLNAQQECHDKDSRGISNSIMLNKKDFPSLAPNYEDATEDKSKMLTLKSTYRNNEDKPHPYFWMAKGNDKSGVPKPQSSKKSHFANELETLLTKELHTRNKDQTENTNDYKNGLTSYSNESPIENTITKIPRPRIPSTTEPLSLRQRAPALLLRKLDAFEEKSNKLGSNSGNECDKNENNLWTKPTINLIGPSPLYRQSIQNTANNQERNFFPSKFASRTPPPSAKKYQDKSLSSPLNHDINISIHMPENSEKAVKLSSKDEENRDTQKKDRLNKIKSDLFQQSNTLFNKENISKKEKKMLQNISKSKHMKHEKQNKEADECNLPTSFPSQTKNESTFSNENALNTVPLPISSSSQPLSIIISRSSNLEGIKSNTNNEERKENNQQHPQSSNQNQILVPTKTGKEPSKKYYPKETTLQQHQGGVVFATTGAPSQIPINPALFSNGNRYIHVTPMLPTVQFTAQQLSTQPHSLPVAFPLPIASNPQVSWTPYTNNHDFRSNETTKNYNAMIQAQALQWRNHQAQLHAAQHAADHHVATLSTNIAPNSMSSKVSRGRSRERGGDRSTKSEIGISSMEQRRRAQSKSPVRQRGINGSTIGRKHVDLEEYERERSRAVNGHEPQSLLSGLQIGRRFRVLGDAVRHAMSGARKSGDRASSGFQGTATPLGTPHLQLKSNLKKYAVGLQQPNISDPKNPTKIPLPSESSLPSENNSDWSIESSTKTTDTSINSRVEGPLNISKVIGNTLAASAATVKSDILHNLTSNGQSSNSNNKEKKKVYFNKFATVQMME